MIDNGVEEIDKWNGMICGGVEDMFLRRERWKYEAGLDYEKDKAIGIKKENDQTIDRGNRLYNGQPSQLMNDIYDGLLARDEDLIKMKGWAILSLYLARTCGAIERKRQLKDKALEYIEKSCLVFENSDKSNQANVQKIMDNIYKYAHCVQESHPCYNVHEGWREELRSQDWSI